MTGQRGSVVERRNKAGEITSYGLRFYIAGTRYYQSAIATDRAGAEQELADTLTLARLGRWTPPVAAPKIPIADVDEVPTFRAYAAEWLAEHKVRKLRSPQSVVSIEWCLGHLVAYFGDDRLDRITVRRVDAFTTAKVADGRLSNGSVNRCVQTLGAVIDRAIEHELIPGPNPTRGRNRRLDVAQHDGSFLELHEITALLDGAANADHRALLAVMAYGGLRVGEAGALRWRDVELGAARIRVGKSKTPAGVRTVEDMFPPLYDALAAHKATTADSSPGAFVFVTKTGRPRNRVTTNQHVLKPALIAANVKLAAAGHPTMALPGEPNGITPHSLRRTYASLLAEINAPIPYAMRQLGHRSPQMTLGLYAKVQQRDRSGLGKRAQELLEASTIEALAAGTTGTNPTDDQLEQAFAELDGSP